MTLRDEQSDGGIDQVHIVDNMKLEFSARHRSTEAWRTRGFGR